MSNKKLAADIKVGRGFGGGKAMGPGGTCKCTKCGYTESHGVGKPCNERKCPKCGAAMDRA